MRYLITHNYIWKLTPVIYIKRPHAKETLIGSIRPPTKETLKDPVIPHAKETLMESIRSPTKETLKDPTDLMLRKH